MPNIFICYSHDDKDDFAKPLIEALRRADYVIWWDDDLLPGVNWDQQIHDWINSCDVFVYLLSDKAIESSDCQKEYAAARKLGKPIIPVLVRDCRYIPEDIKQFQYIDKRAIANQEAAIAKLITSINGKIGSRRNRTAVLGIVAVISLFSVILLLLLSYINRNTLASVTSTPIPLGLSGNPVTSNAQWQPYVEDYASKFDAMEMVLVPAGCFMMGSESDNSSANEHPVSRDCFNTPFWIDRYEVTNAQYGSPGQFSGNNRPRERVSWNDAKRYCDAHGGRLPTEAEWEYAARGPDGLLYPWGNEFVPANLIYKDSSNGETADVGSRPGGVSWVGAYDLSGNVEEWVSTIYDQAAFPYPYATDDGRENTTDTSSSRVLRGGSWNDNNYNVRAAYRDRQGPFAVGNDFGFRCVRAYEPSSRNS